jgi:hypothetical protein
MIRSDLPQFALSIRQPWLWCITMLDKRIENRTWSTKLRGLVCLHAAKGMSRDEFDFCLGFVEHIKPMDVPARDARRMVAYDATTATNRGAIVATANIVDCVTDNDSPWFSGPYGFVLDNVQILADPLPIRGALGFLIGARTCRCIHELNRSR